MPPNAPSQSFNPNMSVALWLKDEYPSVSTLMSDVTGEPLLSECVIGPDEMLYFPNGWMHATLNLDEFNFFISVFIDKQLLDRS